MPACKIKIKHEASSAAVAQSKTLVTPLWCPPGPPPCEQRLLFAGRAPETLPGDAGSGEGSLQGAWTVWELPTLDQRTANKPFCAEPVVATEKSGHRQKGTFSASLSAGQSGWFDCGGCCPVPPAPRSPACTARSCSH